MSKLRLFALAAAVLLVAPARSHAFVRQGPQVAQTANAEHSQANESKDTGEAVDENDQYRLSKVTVAIAKAVHLQPRTMASLLELLNFAVLLGAIAWFMRSKLPGFFRSRSEGLRKQLVEARAATEEANHRLHAIEERLAKLDEEIIGLRGSAERNALHEEERFREMLEAEKQRILDSADQEIYSAGEAARRNLKLFAAELAVSTAEQRLKVTADVDQKIVDEFLSSLEGKS